MCPPRLVDVIADRLRLDHDARVLVALFLDDRIDLRADVLLDAYGIEADMRVDLLVDLFRRHMKEHGQSLDDVLGNRTRQWQERHGEARAVHDERRAVAVEEIAARRDARDDADAVAVRKARIIVAVVDLEIDEPQQKHGDDGNDDAAENSGDHCGCDQNPQTWAELPAKPQPNCGRDHGNEGGGNEGARDCPQGEELELPAEHDAPQSFRR